MSLISRLSAAPLILKKKEKEKEKILYIGVLYYCCEPPGKQQDYS
jgi:hypothetical protein